MTFSFGLGELNYVPCILSEPVACGYRKRRRLGDVAGGRKSFAEA
jgi:hypothetical protein